MADVFISYHEETQIARVNQIAAILKKAGITCWYAKRDVTVGEDFTAKVIQQIKDCKVFLVLLDEGAEHYRHVKTEVGIAFKYDKKIMPYQIDAQDAKNVSWVQYYLKHTQIVTLPDYDALTEQIARALGRPVNQPQAAQPKPETQAVEPKPETPAIKLKTVMPEPKPNKTTEVFAFTLTFVSTCSIFGFFLGSESDFNWFFPIPLDNLFKGILGAFSSYYLSSLLTCIILFIISALMNRATHNPPELVSMSYYATFFLIMVAWVIVGVALGIRMGYMAGGILGAIAGGMIALFLCVSFFLSYMCVLSILEL